MHLFKKLQIPQLIQQSSHPRFNNTTKNQKKGQTCFYKIINCSTDATQEDIQKEYLRLVKLYHPDTNPDAPALVEQFKELQQAYSILSDTEKRKKYDAANGLKSTWSYDGTGSTFGEREQNYEDLLKRKNSQNMDEKTAEQAFDYFDQQYFQNRDQYNKVAYQDDPFELTSQLWKTHKANVQDKQKQYTEHFAFTWKAYYQPTEDEQQLQQMGNMKMWWQDFKIPVLLLFSGVSLFAVFDAINTQNQQKQTVTGSQILTEGPGHRGKLMPLNIV